VQLIAWKDSSSNDPLCVKWDVKPYTVTHFPDVDVWALKCVYVSATLKDICKECVTTYNAFRVRALWGFDCDFTYYTRHSEHFTKF